MRKTTRIAVTGAAALAAAAFGVSGAEAEDGGSGNITIDKVVVNGGKPVVVGSTSPVSFKVSVTVSDDSGINTVSYISPEGPGSNYASAWYEDGDITCVTVSATTKTCSATLKFDPKATVGFVDNSAAGTWNVRTLASAKDYDYIHRDVAGTFKVLRSARLTANASPEPVAKGKKITVTGELTRANWETNTYAGYTSQPVQLQFRKKGSSTYTTVKTVKSSATSRKLSTTVTASTDGYWRWSFAGTSTTAPVKSAGDYLDVR